MERGDAQEASSVPSETMSVNICGGKGIPLVLQLLEDWVGISSLGRKGSTEGNEVVS